MGDLESDDRAFGFEGTLLLRQRGESGGDLLRWGTDRQMGDCVPAQRNAQNA